MVIRATNPVYSVLFLILVFCNVSGILLLLNLVFFAMVFLVVHVGAIAVLYLFVVMMLNVKLSEINDNILLVKRNSESKENRSKHGLYRALIFNMVQGVNVGYTKELELVGVGYRAALKGKQLNLQLGFSHDINFDIPDTVKITVEKQTTLKIIGFDKQEVGMIASKIKSLRPPEPYKGKGIKEKGQYILRKEGKKK